MSLGCGGFLVLLVGFGFFVYFDWGFLVTRMQANFVRSSLERSGAPPDVAMKVDAILEDYEKARKEENLSFGQWSIAAAQFGRTGLVKEMSSRLIGEFVRCVEAKLAAETPAEAAQVQAEEVRGFGLFFSSVASAVAKFFRKLFRRK